MKIPIPIICPSCVNKFTLLSIGEDELPPATCPHCGTLIHIIERLSVSTIADRLLYRSQHELQEGDYTLSIICSAIAVETAFTQTFMKWKRLEYQKETKTQADETQFNTWESQYRKQSNFVSSANFVTQFLVGKTFDEFVEDFYARSSTATLIKAEVPRDKTRATIGHINGELFHRRNKIMHWGEVNYQHKDADIALHASYSAVAILKAMDNERNEAAERAWREGLTTAL